MVDVKEQSLQKAEVLFKPAGWMTKIDFINHLVLFNNSLIAVLAEQGGGKTAFVSLLCAGLDNNIKSHTITASLPFDGENLVSQLAEAFHLRKDFVLSLPALIAQINERKAHVLLIIDNAEHLPDQFIRELLDELQKYESNNFFHACLVSDFSLTASLNQFDRENFKNIVHIIELSPLTESETKTYLLKNLPSPKRLDKTMTEKRLEQFYHLTNGNIARINSQMVNFFNPDPLTSRSPKRNRLRTFAMASSFIIAVVATSYLWKNGAELVSQYTQKPNAVVSAPVIKAAPEQFAVAQMPTIALAEDYVSEIPPFTTGAVSEPLQPPPLNKILNFANTEEDELENLVVMDKVVVIPKTLLKHVAQVAPVQEEKIMSSELAPIKTASASVQDAPQSNGQFTIQIQSGANQEDLKRFIVAHHIGKSAHIHQIIRYDYPWYVLTVGKYNQQSEANAALHKLPANLTKLKPWVRPLNGLKELS